MLPMTGEKIVLSNIKLSDLIKVKKLASDTCCILGVYDKLSGEIAGYVSIFDYNPRNREVEIGYHLIEEFRNK